MITAILSMISPYLIAVGVIADIVGIGAFVYGLITFLKSRGKYRRMIKRISEQHEADVTNGVLIISIPGNIKSDVIKYLKEENKEIGEDYIKELSIDGHIGPEDNFDIEEKIREYKQDFTDLGIDRLMLFIKSPVYIGVIIGSILTNWKPVDVYHNLTVDNKSTYQFQETLSSILKSGG